MRDKQVSMEELEEASRKLKESGIDVTINYVEISMAETRQSPTFGQFNTNKGSMLLGATVAVDVTRKDSREILQKVVDSLLNECGTNLGRVMSTMK